METTILLLPELSVSRKSKKIGKRRRSKYARRNARNGFLLVLQALVLLVLFFIVPLLKVIQMSFYDWPLLGDPSWTGIDNYVEMFQDESFMESVRFSALYAAILVPTLLVIGFLLALLLNEPRRGVGFFRTLFFAPVVVGFASASYLWIYLVNSRVGILDRALVDVGLTEEPVVWLADSKLALLSVLSMVVWKSVGFGTLLLLAGLQSIPGDIVEAARIDRVSWFQMLREIKLPMMRRPIALTLVLSAVGALLSFEQFYLLTGGRANTTPVVMAIFNISFGRFQLGTGAAMSVVLLITVVIISGVQLLILKDQSEVNE